MKPVSINEFLKGSGPIFDVRSPGEFRQGHLPGAINLPLFTDEERVIVGTCYKTVSQEEALLIGLDFVGKKMRSMVEQAQAIVGDGRIARVHCWRGGMRSMAVAQLLGFLKIDTYLLVGGYKSFRRWVLNTVEEPRNIAIVGGLTGSGKTDILHALKASGAFTVDLEALAHHRGSSYGGEIDRPQPSTEQFENSIAIEWAKVNSGQTVWIEDESHAVGTCKIPNTIYKSMQNAPLYLVERPYLERSAILRDGYGHQPKEQLIAATERLSKRLGGVRVALILDAIHHDRFDEAAAMALAYYDKTYTYCLTRRKGPIHPVAGEGLEVSEWASRLLSRQQNL